MDGVNVYDLAALGFGPFFEDQLRSPADATAIPARIAAEHRGGYEVWSHESAGPAQIAGRLRVEPEREGLPGVGDWVVLRDPPGPDRVAVIDRVLSRRTVFTRGSAGREARAQIVAANVDLVFAVCGLDADFNVRRIERYLARIWASGAQPSVILNKADTCDDISARKAEVESRCHDVRVHVTCAIRSEGLDAIQASITGGVTAALVGSSGSGKSTLINALVGEDLMPTGAVRTRDGRGCHVTTHRQLVLLPEGGLLLDTPGMRELELVDEDGLDSVFDDVAALARRCRFRDCTHDDEPGCAVSAAVEAGDLPAERLEHFRKLQREARAYEQRHDEKLQRQTGRLWGQLYDEAARLRRWKGGKE
jgi:ribosome biogenesis GTPase